MVLQLTDSTQIAWLLVLLGLWALLLFGGFAFGRLGAGREHRMPTWTRLASSSVLVFASWSWYLFTRATPAAEYTLLLALGMSLGATGDFCLAGLYRLGQPVLAGIAAFGFGHVAYITALLRFGDAHGLAAPVPRFGAWAAWLLIGFAGWYVVVFRGRKATVLHWAALPYALLLASTAGIAMGLALQAPVFTPLALGGALFLLSDLILAGQLFGGLTFPLIGDAIWLTYGPAQALIVYSVGSVLRMLGRG
jgi:hypothetical protein